MDTRATVLYSFKSTAENELSLIKGAIITLLEFPSNQEWWYGYYQGKNGYFPKNYVEIVESLDTQIIPIREAVALYDFQSGAPNELSLKKGQSIYILDTELSTNHDWYEGSCTDGSYGYFPREFVKLITGNNSTAKPAPNPIAGIVREDSRPKIKRRQSRSKIKKEILTKEDELRNSHVMRRVSALVDRMSVTSHSSEDKSVKVTQIQNIENDLENEKLRNKHLIQEIQEYTDKVIPFLTQDCNALTQENISLKQQLSQQKKENEEMIKLVYALRDVNEIIKLEEERNITMNSINEIYQSEINSLNTQLMAEVRKNNQTSDESLNIITQLQDNLNNETKRNLELQNTLNNKLSEMAIEGQNTMSLLKATGSDLNHYKTLLEESEQNNREWERKYKELEKQNTELISKSNQAQAQFQSEIETLQDKNNRNEVLLEEKTIKGNDYKFKYNSELERNDLLEVKIRQYEEKSAHDSHHINVLKDQVKQLEKDLNQLKSKEKEQQQQPRPLRFSKELNLPEKKKDEEDIDEETLYSFRRAQMFFAAKTQSNTTFNTTKKINK